MPVALVNKSHNVVVNIIEWSANAAYTPAPGLVLRSIPEWVSIGDKADKAKPAEK